MVLGVCNLRRFLRTRLRRLGVVVSAVRKGTFSWTRLAASAFDGVAIWDNPGNMPYINVQITKGASREQKAQLVKEFTDSLVRILGKKPEHTHIVIQEIADEDWGFSGMLTDDWRKTSGSPTN